MFRLSQYMHELIAPEAAEPRRCRPGPVKPVVIWNLTRRCNLRCRHCYTSSADVVFPGELTHAQAMAVLVSTTPAANNPKYGRSPARCRLPIAIIELVESISTAPTRIITG